MLKALYKTLVALFSSRKHVAAFVAAMIAVALIRLHVEIPVVLAIIGAFATAIAGTAYEDGKKTEAAPVPDPLPDAQSET